MARFTATANLMNGITFTLDLTEVDDDGNRVPGTGTHEVVVDVGYDRETALERDGYRRLTDWVPGENDDQETASVESI